MERIFRRSKLTIKFMKVVRIFLLSLGILCFTFPITLSVISSKSMNECLWYFAPFSVLTLLVTWPVLVISKSLKEIIRQYIKIRSEDIEYYAFGKATNINFTDIEIAERKNSYIFVKAGANAILFGNFQNMNEILNLIKSGKRENNESSVLLG